MDWFEQKNQQMADVVEWLESAMLAEQPEEQPKQKTHWSYSQDVEELEQKRSRAYQYAQYAEHPQYGIEMSKVKAIDQEIARLKEYERVHGIAQKTLSINLSNIGQ